MRQHIPETGLRKVVANGLTHAYLERGRGPLVLLLHGFPDTAHTWSEVMPALATAGFRVVAPFGRGIAPSEAPRSEAYDVTDLGQDAVELITALGEESAVVVGHDFGASSAWAAAHIAPERVTQLVVAAIPHPASFQPTLKLAWGARHFLTHRLPGAAKRFARHDYAQVRTLYERWSPGFDWPDSEFEAVRNAYAYPGCLHAALGYYRALRPGWPYKGKVQVPTTVFGGLNDGVARTVDFERSRGQVAAPCDVRMLPGGHFLHREHPEAFISALLDVLLPDAA